MSDNKRTLDKNDDLELDLDSFSLNIDKEIDKLFVPTGFDAEEEKPAEPSEVVFEVTELAPEPPPPPAPVDPVPAKPATGGGGIDLDVDAFDALIDREIDSLFIPSASQEILITPEPAAPVPKAPPQKAKTSILLFEDTPTPVAAKAPPLEIPDEAPVLPSLSFGSFDPVEPPEQPDPEPSPQQELQSLLDEANAAYLSLDWEFSSENARKYELATAKLEPYAKKSNAATSLYKMLQSTARRIRTRPEQAGRDVTEFFRDTHEILGPVLLSQGPLSGWERDKIKSLIERFKTLRQKPPQPTPTDSVKPTPAPPQEARIPAQPSAQPPMRPPAQSELEDARSLTAFREWLELQRSRTDQGIERLCVEAGHLAEIEGILARTSALAPLTSRLARIRKSVEEHVATCRQLSEEWPPQIEWLGRLENNFNLLIDLSASTSDLKVPTPEQAPVEPAASQAVPTRTERLCIFTLSGKTIGILASRVLKIQKASPKKAFKILSRGFATLDDFKSLFGSLKSGLSGEWKALPAKTLKGFHFLPVRCETLDEAPEPHPVGGAILVGSGSKHGIIFTDAPAAEYREDSEIIIDGSTGKEILGFILTESGAPIEILDLDQLMKDME